MVIDPGHNGHNFLHPEATSRPVDAGGYPSESCNTTGTAALDGTTESALNWDVGQRVVAELRTRGATVVLTRADDEGWGPCNDQRGKVAAATGAAALVSVHADGSDIPGAHGFHVVHPGPVPGYTDGIVGPSARFADLVADRLLAAGAVPATYVRGAPVVERDDLVTLTHARVPAVLVELGNLRDPPEAERLTDPAVQATLAVAIADATVDLLVDG